MSDAKAESKRKSTREKTEEDIQYEERLESGTEIKSLAIKRVQTARSRSQVVLYQVDVKTGHAEWATFKRFNAFYEFHQQLVKDLKKCGLPKFPPRHSKILTDHFDRFFIEKRRADLEQYMQSLLRIPGMANQEHMLKFLGVK
uniref:PX domain-containing protein n=1 Tax=Lotharella globosa TaxID=91324 RepID=A0A7S4E073_9EUKA